MLRYVQRGVLAARRREREREREEGVRWEETRTGMKNLSQGIKINNSETQGGNGIPSWALDCFTQWRTFSGQPLSALLPRFLQHPRLIQPASIFKSHGVQTTCINSAHAAMGSQCVVVRTLPWELRDSGPCYSRVHAQASNLVFYKMG